MFTIACLFVLLRKSAAGTTDANLTQDVKELIPEFYYLPEFLLNMNDLPLGSRQDGTPVQNVSLPPWAQGSVRQFVQLHRRALECEYVPCDECVLFGLLEWMRISMCMCPKD
jgi:hypothetical protein